MPTYIIFLGLLPGPDVFVSSGIAPAEDGAQEARFFMASRGRLGGEELVGLAGDVALRQRMISRFDSHHFLPRGLSTCSSFNLRAIPASDSPPR
jgi:hypothetical protein